MLHASYVVVMPKKKVFLPSDENLGKRGTRQHPNRIYELTQARGLTYADVAERVRSNAEARGDKQRTKVHELTINRLATGAISLSQEWMERLGEVYGVPAIDIIAAPSTGNMRLLKVTVALEGGVWRDTHTINPSSQIEIMVPDDVMLQGVALYAAEIRGDAANLRYTDKSIVIVSKMITVPGEIAEGRRYHVRITRADGLCEETIKLLVAREGRYWLRPESDHPDFQTWVPLDGRAGETVEILGRVRGVYFRED
jgi:hypothetical protein